MTGRLVEAHSGILIVSANSPLSFESTSLSTSKPTRCAPTPILIGVIAGRYSHFTATVVPGGPKAGEKVAIR
jgi:hypothetical protein